MKQLKTKNPIKPNKMDNGDYILHGDVILFKEHNPSNFKTMNFLKDGILAIGEVTNHYHGLFDGEFELREDQKTKTRHLKVVKECFLRHQEHNPVAIPPGEYRIGIQREYSPWEKLIRNVAD